MAVYGAIILVSGRVKLKRMVVEDNDARVFGLGVVLLAVIVILFHPSSASSEKLWWKYAMMVLWVLALGCFGVFLYRMV